MDPRAHPPYRSLSTFLSQHVLCFIEGCTLFGCFPSCYCTGYISHDHFLAFWRANTPMMEWKRFTRRHLLRRRNSESLFSLKALTKMTIQVCKKQTHHKIIRTTSIEEEVMADKKCQQNFGSWKTTGLMVTDLVDDRSGTTCSQKAKSRIEPGGGART